MFIKPGESRLFISVKERLALIFVPFLICTVVVILINLKPVYQIEAIIYPAISPLADIQRGALKGLDRSVRRLAVLQYRQKKQNSAMEFQTKLALLESRSLVEGYITENRLKPMLYPQRWDETNQSWKEREPGILSAIFGSFASTELVGENEKEPKEPLTSRAAEMFSKTLNIKANEKNGLIYVSLKWPDPAVGAKLVNGFLDYASFFIARRDQENNLQKIDNVKVLLAKEQITIMKKALLDELESLQSSVITSNPALNPAFEILDPAMAPEESSFKAPKLMLVLLFISGAMFTFAGIAWQRHKKTHKIRLGNDSVTNSIRRSPISSHKWE